MLSGFVEKFEPTLDIDDAVRGRLGGGPWDFGKQGLDPEDVVAVDLPENGDGSRHEILDVRDQRERRFIVRVQFSEMSRDGLGEWCGEEAIAARSQ